MISFRRRWLALLSAGAMAAAAPVPLMSADPAAATPVAGATDAQVDELEALVNEAISITSRRYLTADVHTPWQIMHGILALRSDFVIKIDGEKRPAIEWLTSGTEYRGLPIIERTQWGGRFHPFTVPYAFEGHPNQFLAILTMSEYPETFSFRTADGGQVTIEDMVRNAQMTVNDREEITWTLWALSRYLPPDAEWVSAEGEAWSMERLVQIQTYANPNDAACGGTHGLFALSLARNSYMATGKPLRGIWLEADQKIKRYVQITRSLQNSDGSLSSQHFRGPGFSNDFGERIATTGHVLEFLMVGADQPQLESQWLRDAVRSVARDLIDNRRAAADCGPLYHALHALVLYRQRLQFEPVDTVAVEAQLAKLGPEPQRLNPDNAVAPAVDGSVQETVAGQQATDTLPTREESVTVARPAFTDPPAAAIRKPIVEPEASAQTPDTTVESRSADAAASADSSPAAPPMPESGPASIVAPITEPDTAAADATAEDDSRDAAAADAATRSTESASGVQTGSDLSDAAPRAVAESYRSPEDNAYRVPSVPQVMDDGYEIPLPPTED